MVRKAIGLTTALNIVVLGGHRSGAHSLPTRRYADVIDSTLCFAFRRWHRHVVGRST